MKKEKTLSDKIVYNFIQDNGVIFVDEIKQSIKDLNDFMKERTLIKKGFPSRIVFLEFEWKDFLKEKLGEELLK